MDPVALFFSAQGRLGRRPFAWAALAVYVAGFASQALLSPSVTTRSGLWPFIVVQAALIWAWLALHFKRLRDAKQEIAGAIGVALIYSLAVALLLLVVALFTGFAGGSQADRPPGAPPPAGVAAIGLILVVLVFGLLFSPDFGVFATLVKILVVVACLPALISFAFSLWAGTRPTAS
jgi:uncharacterized membrane protein YhaH (DUF805 family)